MASAFGHAFAAYALGTTFKKQIRSKKFLLLGMLCSIFPDADVISFKFGIPYESFWGHRGFTHSFLFAFIFGVIITTLFYKSQLFSKRGVVYSMYFFLCTASHSILDAMTSGGLGVAFFSPFNNERFFFPFRPIKVSPIGMEEFFGEWGLRVILSELFWIGIPFLMLILVNKLISKKMKA